MQEGNGPDRQRRRPRGLPGCRQENRHHRRPETFRVSRRGRARRAEIARLVPHLLVQERELRMKKKLERFAGAAETGQATAIQWSH